jgi:protein-S-isoprenylcysteine O-methyltransferase Ste14
MSQKPAWYKGARGEWYVVAQGLLFCLAIFGPRGQGLLPKAGGGLGLGLRIAGALLGLAGAWLFAAAAFGLGSSLTALPKPKEGGQLVTTGAYGIVRHPIYAGILCLILGWALWLQALLALAWALLFFIFFDIKSRREEAWLKEKYEGYAAYQKKVKKLVPWVY